jgi:diguanylate cyclase (GGDEF)-like protein
VWGIGTVSIRSRVRVAIPSLPRRVPTPTPRQVIAGAAAALVLLGVAGAFAIRSLGALDDMQRLIDRTAGMVESVNGVRAAALEAETRQRAYLLSGVAVEREAYAEAERTARAALARTRERAAGGPVEARDVATLERLLEQRFTQLRAGMRLRDSVGFDAALGMLRGGRGQLTMDSIDVLGERLVGAERAQMGARARAKQRTARAARVAIVGLAVAAALVVLSAGRVVQRDAGRRRVAERELRRTVEELRASEARLAHQAVHDGLTGLANRALFQDRVAHALARVARPPHGDGAGAQLVGVLFVDLDDFKAVNDTFGHAAGDKLLMGVADRLTHRVRAADTVARLGGDEFAIVVEAADSVEEVRMVAERVSAAFAEPIALEGTEAMVNASIGVATGSAGCTADALLRNADAALYVAKGRGKRRHVLFSPEMATAIHSRMTLEAELRRAFDRDELRVYYQPVVRLASGRLVGAEALVRWHHPERGLLAPSEFIPLAEDTGLVVPLGRWVLRQACREAAAWRSARPTPPGVAGARAQRPGAGGAAGAERGLSVSVNLSARQLQGSDLVRDVEAALAESGLAPGELTLELTESVLLRDSASALACLAELKAMGVRLAIDDFGVGYSSLSYLQQFPVDLLKIDKAFVDAAGRQAHEPVLVRAMVSLAGTLGLECVAEGIERQAQHDALRSLGCEFGQGYLFARPLPAPEFSRVVAWGLQAAPALPA